MYSFKSFQYKRYYQYICIHNGSEKIHMKKNMIHMRENM